jgi:hypothetical protein
VYLRQSLRHRRLQTVVLVGVSTLIAGCAAFGPLFARAVEQSITSNTLQTQRNQASLQLSADPPPTEVGIDPGQQQTMRPEDVAANLPAGFDGRLEQPQLAMTVKGGDWLRPGQRVGGIMAELTWVDRFCDHIVMVKGSCPARAGEVALSLADRGNYGVDVGGQLLFHSLDHRARAPMRVTGVYRADPADPFWYGVSPIGKSRPGEEIGGAGDVLFTPRATLEDALWGHTSQVQAAPLPGRMRVDDLPALADWVESSRFELDKVGVTLRSQLPDVVSRIDDGRKQAVRIIPLVMIQVAIFGLVVLALAAGAVIDQRRPELAIARLRGRSPTRAGREVFAEMGLLVVIGTLAGGVLAFAVTALVRRTWLAGGAPAELTWTTPAAVVLALVAGLASILVALRPVVRQPVATLLRTVPVRRHGRALTTVDVVLVTIAVAGLVATLTGDGRGPLAIVTPTLLAVAVGLLMAGVLVLAAGPAGADALRRGRIAFGLAALQVARRRIAVRLVPVVAVATALVAFAGQASSIADRNRELRSGLETGADTVLASSSNDIRQVRGVLDTVDKDRNWSTLVATSAPPSAKGLRMVGIETDSFRRIAIGGDAVTDDATFQRLRAPQVAPIAFRGSTVTVTAGPVTATTERNPQSVEEDTPTKAITLAVSYVNSLRVRATTMLGNLPVRSGRPTTLTADVNCHGGCQLLRIHIGRETGDVKQMRGEVTITGLRGDADGAPIPLGRSGWNEFGAGDDADGTISSSTQADGLRLKFVSFGAELMVQHPFVPTVVPVVVTPDVGLSDEASTTAPALDGQPLPVRSAGRATGPVPRNLYGSSVTDLTTLTRWGGPEPQIRTNAEVWLNHEGARHLDQITAAFAKARITLRVSERLADSDGRYARSASALALRLTPVVGIAAWSLALVVLLLLAVSTRRARTYDNAGLQLTGVHARTTARSTRLEQIGLVALAAIVGTVCGVVGGQLALPLIPLFETEQPAIPVDLGISWPAAVLSLMVSGAVLCAGAWLVALALRRRTRFGVIREELA